MHGVGAGLERDEEGGILAAGGEAGAIILHGVTIGHGAVVAAGTVVNRSVPPKTMVQGNPGRFVATIEMPLRNNVPMQEFMRGYRPIKNRRDLK